MDVRGTEEWERFVRRADRRLWEAGRASGVFEPRVPRPVDATAIAGLATVWFTKCLVRDRDGRVLHGELVESFRAFSGKAASGRKLIPLFRALAGNPERVRLYSGYARGFRGWRLAS